MHTIAAQQSADDIVIYAAIGKKMSEIKSIYQTLKEKMRTLLARNYHINVRP
jgi:F0F1-type ATP synthase alpha subunit